MIKACSLLFRFVATVDRNLHLLRVAIYESHVLIVATTDKCFSKQSRKFYANEREGKEDKREGEAKSKSFRTLLIRKKSIDRSIRMSEFAKYTKKIELARHFQLHNKAQALHPLINICENVMQSYNVQIFK